MAKPASIEPVDPALKAEGICEYPELLEHTTAVDPASISEVTLDIGGQPSELWKAIADGDLDPKQIR